MKRCGFCGSDELVREARAAAARVPRAAWPADDSRITDASGRRSWPRTLAAPRDRLRRGAPAVALAVATFAVCAAGALHWIGPVVAATVASGFAAFTLGWLLYAAVRASRLEEKFSACRAWDATGRPLQIECVG
jgi:hypothetical protein